MKKSFFKISMIIIVVFITFFTNKKDTFAETCYWVSPFTHISDKNLPSHFLIDLMGRNVVKAFLNSSPIIDRLRMIKDEEEIQAAIDAEEKAEEVEEIEEESIEESESNEDKEEKDDIEEESLEEEEVDKAEEIEEESETDTKDEKPSSTEDEVEKIEEKPKKEKTKKSSHKK